MQTTGYIIIDNKKILVLIRDGKKLDKFCRIKLIKLRKSGEDGYFMTDESDFLNESPDLIKRLKGGDVIEC